MTKQQRPALTPFIISNLKYFPTRTWDFASGHLPGKAHNVARDFFGICAASSPDPVCDEYVIERLRELQIGSARVDFTYGGFDTYPERFLNRLLASGFRICLHLVVPFEEARSMDKEEARTRWRHFLARVLDRCGGSVEMLEIGSTCNRRKWSGFTIGSYLQVWQLAHQAAVRKNVSLAGPNVTDFEPLYNIGLLGAMERRGILPDVHSFNLFVERAREPEAFDSRVLGARLAGALKFNLIKKARFLRDVSDHFGIRRTACSHVSWSLRRIQRLEVDAEQKQADYLSRYCCLAAASGGLDKLYWGPLIGQREGLIDDGTEEYPPVPHAAFYGRANGRVPTYRVRPAFHAFQAVIKFLSGARFVRKVPSHHGLEIHEFISGEHRVHVAWTMDGRRARASDCYHASSLAAAAASARNGEKVARSPEMFSESPIYLVWPLNATVSVKGDPRPLEAIRFCSLPDIDFQTLRTARWNGICVTRSDRRTPEMSVLLPERLAEITPRKTFRNSRNVVWSIPDPRDPQAHPIVVKRFRAGGTAAVLQRQKQNKALRSWNGANELIRRGISTPRPVAFFESNKKREASDSYFLCEQSPTDFTIRQAFTAFARGENTFQGVPQAAIFHDLAQFLSRMHTRGVYFRDLSPGNLLLHIHDGCVELALVDTGRARFLARPVSLNQRLNDLKRVCHPLHWQGRRVLVETYMTMNDRAFAKWMLWPFLGYDLKHSLKNSLRSSLRKK